MILERENWHLGYASLLRDCRGIASSSTSNDDDEFSSSGVGAGVGVGGGVGRALLLVHPDTDAMATARILSYMLRADGVPYQMRPCLGWTSLRRILGKVGVIRPDNNNNGNGNGNGNDGEDEEGEDNTSNWIENETDIRAVVLMNMGANRNLAKLFRGATTNNNNNMNDPSQDDSFFGMNNNVRCYVFDCHRPYHLANVHAGRHVVLFNDRPFEEEEIPSDGDNLSGDESSSSDSSSSGEESDSDDDDDDFGGRKKKKNESDDEGEHEFEESDVDSDDEDDTGTGRRLAKRQRRTRREEEEIDPADDPAQDPDQRQRDGEDDLQDSEDEDDDDEHGTMKKKRSGDNGPNPLDTTAATADLTNVLDETVNLDRSTVDVYDGEGNLLPTTSFRDLRRRRRNRIRLHYSCGSYHASPSSWTAYALCRQLRFGDTPDLLWLACVGVTDAFLHGRLDVAGYSALAVDLKRHVGRLFPNDLVDRAGRAVYAEELEASLSSGGGNNSNELRTWTQIGLSENGRILFQDEYKFMLLRHTSLWDSLLHSNFVASKLQVWKSAGRQKLMELLAKMGFPLDQCRQPWAFVGPGMRRRLGERLDECTEEYGLGNVSYTGFVRVTGYKSLLSASDMSYAVTALLECAAAAFEAGSGDNDEADDNLNEEDREDREMIEAFNVAFDALNSNGSTSSAATRTLASMEGGGVEGADLSNLVNGGNMTGSTGLGAGIRLAMTLQRNIMATARSLVDRNAITRLSHFRYAYIPCSSAGAASSSSGPGGRVVTPDASKNGDSTSRSASQFHVFAKPLVLTKLAHFLMDVHRENGKWTGIKSRPLVLLAEKPRSNTYMVVGYEYPEESGNVVRNKFGQNFELAAKSMKGMFWFDSFDSNVVEVAAKDVQKFLEQLHYMMEQV